jgi:hypothetical protein
MAKATTGQRISMPCPFCDEPAMVKACLGNKIRGAKGQDWYWRCACNARGFFPDQHFRRLDKLKKISFNN